MITVEFDQKLIDRELRRLKAVPYAVQKVLYPAISEVLHEARRNLAEQLTADLPLSPRFIAASIKLAVNYATAAGAEGSLTVASKAVPLIDYGVTPAQVTARKGMRSKQWPGFSYSLRSGEARSREALVGTFGAGLPFIAQMRNSTGKRRGGAMHAAQSGGGHLGVYARTVFGQLKELYGPPLQYHATTPEMERMLLAKSQETFERVLPRMVDAALASHGGAS